MTTPNLQHQLGQIRVNPMDWEVSGVAQIDSVNFDLSWYVIPIHTRILTVQLDYGNTTSPCPTPRHIEVYGTPSRYPIFLTSSVHLMPGATASSSLKLRQVLSTLSHLPTYQRLLSDIYWPAHTDANALAAGRSSVGPPRNVYAGIIAHHSNPSHDVNLICAFYADTNYRLSGPPLKPFLGVVADTDVKLRHITDDRYPFRGSKNKSTVYDVTETSCTCPAWKFNKKNPSMRTCKHTTQYAAFVRRGLIPKWS